MSVARDVPAVINATMEHAEASCPVAAFCHLAHSGHMTYVASFIEAAMNQDCGRGCWREIVMDDKGVACLFVLVGEWVVHHARQFEEKNQLLLRRFRKVSSWYHPLGEYTGLSQAHSVFRGPTVDY
jgi:hypothetical protein